MSSGGDRYFKGKAARKAILGAKVDKATTAVTSTAADLFKIVGGRILLTSIVGETTIATTAASTELQLRANPTTGTTTALCAVLDTTGDEIGCLYGITGAFGDALVGTDAGATIILSHPVVLDIGSIEMYTAHSETVGYIKWTATYIPWDKGAEMYSA